MDLFHKKELASLKSELTRLKGLIPDEAIDKADFLLSLDDKIAQKNQELSKLDEAIALRKGQEQQLDTTLAEKNTQIVQLDEVDNSIKDVDYREANARAGYVYIISNIGAFGENVYKIGMTRRLDPMERVIELGDASVPFNFDVHAMIFTEDAPALEAALHRAFEDKKLNFVNQRREFFNVTLDEIKKVIRDNFDKTVEYVDVPAAEQYRVSLKMKQERQTVSV